MQNKHFLKSLSLVFVLTSLASLGLLSTLSSPASATDSGTTEVQLTLAKQPYRIAIASATNVTGQTLTKNAAPSSNPADAVGIIADQLQVSFNTPNGYEVYVSMSSTSENQNLTNTTDSTKYLAPITSGSFTAPSNLSTANTWGIAVPSTYNSAFDAAASYTDGSVTTSTKFAPIPSYNNEQILFTRDNSDSVTNFPTAAVDTVPVYYGYNADLTLPSGAYTNKVLYTAIAEGAMTQDNKLIIFPTKVDSISGGQTLTISTDLYVPSGNNMGAVNVTVGGEPCTNIARLSEENTDAVTLTCTLPAQSTNGRYTVEVTFDKYNKVMTSSQGVIYGDRKSTLQVVYGVGVAGVTIDGDTVANKGTVELDWGSTHNIDMSFNSGYEFKQWIITDGIIEDASAQTTTYTIGENNTTLTANGKQSCSLHITFTGTMQNYSTTNIANACEGDTGTLTDSRDSKTYNVAKLGGLLWMTQNLRFTGTSISSSSTNINTSKTLTWYDLVNGASSNDPCYGSYSNSTFTGDGWSNLCKHEGIDNEGNPTVWYNYAAATAGTVIHKSSSTINAQYSICPAGWRLPTASERETLRAEANIDTDLMNTLHPVYGGYYRSGVLYTASSAGFWWLSSPNLGQDYMYMYYNGGKLYLGGMYRYHGIYVRCVRSSS